MGADQLLVSFKKPHKEVNSQTISRWLKMVMEKAGIDKSFTAHSTRHASTPKARLKGLNISTIKGTAGWSKASSSTFAKFYDRPVQRLEESFAEVILSQHSD